MQRKILSLLATTAIVASAGTATAADVAVGNLLDFTGRTAVVGKVYGQSKIDAMNYVNETGGINGKMLDVDTVGYSYIVPRAIAAYKKWRKKVVAIQGWGTGDTEALIGFVAKDKIPYLSASYSGHLVDPMGKGPKTKKAAPYNFIMGPSYSDGARALVQWAAADWKKKGGSGKPKYIHMGDNHPYPNAPKAAAEEYAKELGFEVLNPIQYSLAPGDFKAQCLSLKESGANYAFLANTSGSNISLLKSCGTVGTDVQFMANIWGFDENVMKAAGKHADGVTWVMGSAKWGDNVPGMKTVEAISKMSDPTGNAYRAVHYMRGVCSVYFMKEALEWADKNGGISGENLKKAFYHKENWVPKGLEGVCPAATWKPDDHRGFNLVFIYQASVKGDTTKGSVAELMAAGAIGMSKVGESTIPRKPEWLGW